MTVTLALVALVITGKGQEVGLAILITKVSVSFPQPLVAMILTLNAPAAVGVPEITPVEVEKLRPAGKVPERLKFVVVVAEEVVAVMA